jgi:uncharacterized protein YndB with AHSA1/START domain
MSGQPDGTTPPASVERLGDGRHVLRFERWLRHPIERVWSALTDPGELRGWLAEAELELVEGGRVELRWLNSDEHGNRAVARGVVTSLEPLRLLELDTDIHGLLRWELNEEEGGCRLTFTTVTPAPPDFLSKVAAGWHIHMDHLADLLEGHPVDWAIWTPDFRAHGSGASWADHERLYSNLVEGLDSATV